MMRPLLLLPLLLLVTAAAAPEEPAESPRPRAWPEQFHAVLLTNMTASGGQLMLTDLYYDWPNGRNLNIIRRQLSGDPLYDVEWTNGTSYYFDSASCQVRLFPVGVLPPDWLAPGAVYLGRARTGGFDCHVWSKVDFIVYYEDVLTGRPVRWDFFDGMQQYVMSFEVGKVLEDSKWQAPSYCFTDGNAAATAVAIDDGIGGDDTDGETDMMSSLLRRFSSATVAAF